MDVTHLRSCPTLTFLSPTCSHLRFCRDAQSLGASASEKRDMRRGTIHKLLSLQEETVLLGRTCSNNQNHVEWVSETVPLPVILPCPLLTKRESKHILMLGGAIFFAFMNTRDCMFIYPKLTRPCYPFSLSIICLISAVSVTSVSLLSYRHCLIAPGGALGDLGMVSWLTANFSCDQMEAIVTWDTL